MAELMILLHQKPKIIKLKEKTVQKMGFVLILLDQNHIQRQSFFQVLKNIL